MRLGRSSFWLGDEAFDRGGAAGGDRPLGRDELGCVTVDFDGDRGWPRGHGDGDVVEVA